MLSTICKTFKLIAQKIEIRTSFFIPRKFFQILDRLGLNFYAINLKFLQFVGITINRGCSLYGPVRY